MEEKAGRPMRPVYLPFPDTHSLKLPHILIRKTYMYMQYIYIMHNILNKVYIMPKS